MATTYKTASAEDVRTWARANGYQVGDRGRFSTDLIREFDKAHKRNRVRYDPSVGQATRTVAPAKKAAPAKATAAPRQAPRAATSAPQTSSPRQRVAAKVGEFPMSGLSDMFAALTAASEGAEGDGPILVSVNRLIHV